MRAGVTVRAFGDREPRTSRNGRCDDVSNELRNFAVLLETERECDFGVIPLGARYLAPNVVLRTGYIM